MRKLITQSGIVQRADGAGHNIKLYHNQHIMAFIVEVRSIQPYVSTVSSSFTNYFYTKRFGSHMTAFEDAVEQYNRIRQMHTRAAA